MQKHTLSRMTVAFALLTLLGCQHPAPVSHEDKAAETPKTAEANLTQIEAANRKKSISDIQYQLMIRLAQESESFSGEEKIQFTWSGSGGTFVDFEQGALIQKMMVNGQLQSHPQFSNHRLALAAELLKQGQNTIELVYTQKFSHDGRGLHRFVDPVDHKVYLYSQFESFDAHQMFACFDQPDLKAKMTLSTLAPKGWQVISTTRETKQAATEAGVLWTFPQTPVMSTYLYSLHAGPYHKWESQAGSIPLRLFSRESLAQYVVPKDWFQPTQQGLKFYGRYFAYPYPFKKYDQIIAPDFNAGAMENVAAITFTERFVHRGAISREDRKNLASVILHEMAHMWFGDLVTMQWWDNLWLNESFATFMSAVAMDKATEFNESWKSFYQSEKSWAYHEDQLVTTHPINGEVIDTESTFVNFDGITYGKGASVLKQLSFYLGEENFRKGVQSYFKIHAYGNTQLKDFIGSLEKVSGKDLTNWSTSWLRQAGLDTVIADYECSNGKISRFELKLTSPDGGASPRTHRTIVSLYKKMGEKLKVFQSVETEYSHSVTAVPALVGKICPSFVDPNDHDNDYVKNQLDDRSLATAKAQLDKIDSSLTRLVVWSDLFQMVRDARLTPKEYFQVELNQFPKESDLYVGQEATGSLSQALYYLPDYGSVTEDALAGKIETMLSHRLQSAAAGSDWQKIAFKEFAGNVQTQAGRDQIFELLTGKTQLKGLTLDTDRRWALILRLSSLGDERAKALLEEQKKSDTSEFGIQWASSCEAAWPSLEVKRKFFDESLQHPEIGFSRERAAFREILPHWQDKLRSELGPSYFTALPEIMQNRQEEFIGLFSKTFLPVTCSVESVAQVSEFLTAHPDNLPSNLKKNLLVGRQEDERCVNIRATAKKSI